MTPYEVYFYSSGGVEDRWSPKDIGLNRANAIIGYGLGGFLSLALMIVGGALFLGHGISPEHLGTIALGAEDPLGQDRPAARARRDPVRGRRRLDRHGLLGRVQPRAVLRLGVGPLPAPARRAALHTHLARAARARRSRSSCTGVDPVMLTEYAVIFSVVALPLTYIPILLVANDRTYMGRYRNGRLANVLGLVYLVVIMVVALTADPADGAHERGPELSGSEIDIGLHVLDHQLLDKDGRRCGNVDDLAIEGGAGETPRSSRSSSARATGRSAPGWIGRLAGWIGGGRRVRVDWGDVRKIDSAVELKREAHRARPRPRRRPPAPLPRQDPGSRPVRTLSSLLRRKVVTESGHSLGRCHDLRGELTALEAARHRPLRRARRLARAPRHPRPRRPPNRSLERRRPDRGQADHRPRRRARLERLGRRAGEHPARDVHRRARSPRRRARRRRPCRRAAGRRRGRS